MSHHSCSRWSVVSLLLCSLPRPAFAAYCPSYSPANTSCGVEPALGTNPSISTWNSLFADVARGPDAWGAGPTVDTIKQGCASPVQRAPTVPCVVLKAKVMQESSWYHFCKPTLPSSAVGSPSRTLITFDCGYGASQITSFMKKGESAAFSRSRVASEPRYNLQVGLKILADKWDGVNCVGTRQPDVAEHWYSALWAYNGLSYINNPNNPNKRSGRGVYKPSANSGSQSRWTYSERVFGAVEYPPDSRYWSSVALAYPNRADVGTGSSPRSLPTPACSTPTSCANARPLHSGSCGPVAVVVGDAGTRTDASSSTDASDDVDIDFMPPPENDEDAGDDQVPDLAITPTSTSSGSSCLCDLKQSGESKSWVLSFIALCMLVQRRLPRRGAVTRQ